VRIYFPAKNNYGMECPGGDEARGRPEGRRRGCRGTVGLEGHLQPSACETLNVTTRGVVSRSPSSQVCPSRFPPSVWVLRDANAGAGGALKISKCGIFAVLKMVLEITAGRARVENNYGRRASDIVSGCMPRTSCGKCSRPAGSRPRRRSAASGSYRGGNSAGSS
jgi:hypothetical protein